ncbi:uncharacterized protein BCR38DRAFT_236296 [Pseudomassariella vexata]|uniref:Uncharacterized protein n=1 Tax=Pseudomassariella vexata TaxID=1141098 RepID=A0A1Y2DSL4_9PEZI|nr:uncharacterized protein BCR38DRAFT_236296 [Pseudomassariella vexata]ORY62273.1 hypothetical protein BCR38DRAFT_236296 [Pseudomassariella vexata]
MLKRITDELETSIFLLLYIAIRTQEGTSLDLCEKDERLFFFFFNEHFMNGTKRIDDGRTDGGFGIQLRILTYPRRANRWGLAPYDRNWRFFLSDPWAQKVMI